MGCLFSRLFRGASPKSPTSKNKNEIELFDIDGPGRSSYELEPTHPSLQSIPPLPEQEPIRQISQRNGSRVLLHTPIYIALRSYGTTNNTHISFDEGDEMELIKEINSTDLHVNHLRTGLSGIVPKHFVRLDVDTPLRLAVKDRGITQRCLMEYNMPGAYLIRRCGGNPRDFALSVSQVHQGRNTFEWHYLICINPSNNCFYFHRQDKLDNIFFSSFQQIIADERVRNIIPLTEILPYSIEFKEEVWKIPFDELAIEDKIGEGQFGEVWRASWHKDRKVIPVAIKKLHIRGVTNTVEREIEAMKNLTNLYIVALYGIAQNLDTNEFLIVTELMENGDLKSWLKRLPNLPEYSTLLHFSRDISNGMAFLELRNYVHRDLACRNVLLGSLANNVKIADFGLSTIANNDDIDRRQEAHSEKLPIRWLAPELFHNQAAYSIKSDVWSFGILLIELWLKGGDPYGEKHLLWIQSAVSTGYVHEKPADCPDDFYESVICPCLRFKANDRPSFAALRQLLEKWQC